MNNIVLIGFMGCGKTTFGKWIAKHHGMDFIDTDDYIEFVQKRSINEIFADQGEEYFRDLETQTIKKLAESVNNSVISVGGGLPVRECNRALLKKLGKVVFLDTSIDELEKRLSKDTKRPLLAGGKVRDKIEALMRARKDIYESTADCIITTDNQSFEAMYDNIIHS